MRLLPNWIDAFKEYTAGLPSPMIFRQWGAIACIAGALERKVWIRSMKMDFFPNIYTILVAPPGIGKSVITSTVEQFWRGLSQHHVAPKSLSKASLIDSLNDAKRTKTIIGPDSIHLDFNSLLVNAGELSVLIPAYDSDFMSILTDIYDGNIYEERRRGKDLHIIIKRPQLNILGATTPSYLNGMLPEGAWDQGFLSRTFLVYGGEKILRDLFAEDDAPHDELEQKMKSDLRQIGDMAGQMGLTTEARMQISEWHMAGGPPTPDHPKLVHYLTRRSGHLLKLCMIACAARTNDKLITGDDVATALGWLTSMEFTLPDIFKALGARGDGQTIEEVWHYIYNYYMANKDPMPEHRLVGFISERVPSYSVLRIMEIMMKSGQIQEAITKSGAPGYKPMPRQVH